MPCIEIVNEFTFKLHFDTNKVTQSADKIAYLVEALSHSDEAILDLIPAYTTLTIILDFRTVTAKKIRSFKNTLNSLLDNAEKQTHAPTANHSAKNHTLPCLYDTNNNWDLYTLAKHHKLDAEEVIHIHGSKTYRVFAIGFSPGFPYLGFVDSRIATPRKTQPRIHVPKGAVGIAGEQTGIYPQVSPGGWNIIGVCPIELFKIDYEKNTTSSKLKVGDSVNFKSICQQEHDDLVGGNNPNTNYAKHNDQ